MTCCLLRLSPSRSVPVSSSRSPAMRCSSPPPRCSSENAGLLLLLHDRHPLCLPPASPSLLVLLCLPCGMICMCINQ